MELSFRTELASAYKSRQQNARVLSEDWVGHEIYCPNCGRLDVARRSNNSRIGDFFCTDCKEEYEVKSLSHPFRAKVEDGEYRTMMGRLKSVTNPNFFLLHYDPSRFSVVNFIVIPKHFFVPEIIEARRPLSQDARRKGWTGCRILLRDIPLAGRIYLVRDQVIEPKDRVLTIWRQTLFLRDQVSGAAKGWLLQVMKCIEKVQKRSFTIDELYAFEYDLRRIYPDNRHIKEKMRQQLQVLRDKGYLEFTGKGTYRLAATGAGTVKEWRGH